MNRRILIIVLCALVLSACASYLVYRTVATRPVAGKAPPSVEVVVAARELAVGTLIHDADLSTAQWFGPRPAGAALKRDVLLNRGVVSPIYAGEPVTEQRLAPVGSGGGLAATIPPGMRACAVRVNEVVGVAGFVVPGMRVDVLITGLPPGGNALDGARVRTLLQDIQVLSAGVNFQQDKEGKPEQAQVVNLLVTPSQAEILSLASNESHIQLVLRNPMDTQVSALPGTIVSALYGGPRAPDPVPPADDRRTQSAMHPAAPAVPGTAAPRLYTIEVSNGSVNSQVTFSRPGGTR
jgi:pilus assembly protein CpaB